MNRKNNSNSSYKVCSFEDFVDLSKTLEINVGNMYQVIDVSEDERMLALQAHYFTMGDNEKLTGWLQFKPNDIFTIVDISCRHNNSEDRAQTVIIKILMNNNVYVLIELYAAAKNIFMYSIKKL